MEGGHFISRVVQLPHRVWIILLSILVVLVIGQPLFSEDRIISESSTDIAYHFFFSRGFGFGEIARGNFPLWNPFTYAGAPYMGHFEAALLYPLNYFFFLILPIVPAFNWSIAFHVFLFGLGIYVWLIRQHISRPSSFLGAVALMFGGTFFMRTYAGHITILCTLAWLPFLFVCIDSWLTERRTKWILLASLAVALQIYAGHPQFVYYTAIVATFYVLVQGMGRPRPILAAVGFFCIYPLAALLAAAQLWPGLRAAAENLRSGGTDHAFASMFSFPPENLLTLIAPWFFGDLRSIPYWGRCYLWEMEVYMGVGILLLAVYGAAGLRGRGLWRSLLLLGIAFLLALGCRVPLLYDWMHHAVPFYNSLRGTSKFLFFVAFFLVFFAAKGFDRLLLSREKPIWSWGVIPIGIGVFFIVVALLILTSGPLESWWQWGWNKIFSSGESYLPESVLNSVEMREMAKRGAARSLMMSGWILAVFGVAMTIRRRWQEVLLFIGVGAIVEVAVFAHQTITTFSLRDVVPSSLTKAATEVESDSRVLNLVNPDASPFLQNEGVWGYDHSVLKRYAHLLAHSQGANPDRAIYSLTFNRKSKILELLRCKKVFYAANKEVDQVELKSDFPRFFLAGTAIVVSGRDAVFSAMDRANLRNEVILEESPQPPPAGSSPIGTIKVLECSNNYWRLQVTTDRPALLVNTDAWSVDWRARALPESVQKNYRVLPADFAIRAIPLQTGDHLLELVYWPRGWGAAIAVSVFSILGVFSLLGYQLTTENRSLTG